MVIICYNKDSFLKLFFHLLPSKDSSSGESFLCLERGDSPLMGKSLSVLIGATLRASTAADINKELKALSKQLETIKVKVNFGRNLDSSFKKIVQGFKKARVSAQGLSTSVVNTISRIRELNGEVQKLAERLNSIRNARITINNTARNPSESWKDAQANLNRQMENSIVNLRSRFGGMFNEAEFREIYNINSRIESVLQNQNATWDDIRREIDACRGNARLFQSNLTASQRAANQLRQQTQLISDSMSRFAQFYVFGELFRLAKMGLRGIYTAIKDVDTSMVELKKVTDETEQTYAKFQQTAGKTAKQLGVTLTDYIDATTNFARMDVGGFEAAQEVAKTANIMQAVAEDLDADTASSYLISTMKAFDIEAKDTIRIVDVLNNIDRCPCMET